MAVPMPDTRRSFLWRHGQLMADPGARLPCCFFDKTTTQFCEDDATYGVVDAQGWTVRETTALPKLRDRHDAVGGTSPLRSHPEFCAVHAAVVCAQRTGAPVGI
jgi:hypothetical protein